jgi:hypothetical protein
MKPIILGTKLFRRRAGRMGHKGHHYDGAQDNDAAGSVSAAASTN